MVTNSRENLPLALHTPLLELLNCELPVMNAGMGGVARSELAAAVCNAGGFGCLGMAREPVSRIVEEVNALRARCDRPFAVNLVPAATKPTLLLQQVDACLNLQVPAIVLFWDVDPDLIQELKQHRVLVLHQVGSRSDAECALRAGADVLIAQGMEAGGHVRGNVSTLALTPDLVAMSPVPVVASGGIATGAGLVAALALGAQGISCGSLFLATHESNAHPLHQKQLCNAHAEDTLHTYRFYRDWPTAAPVRVLPNGVTQGDYDHLRNQREPTTIANQDGHAIDLFSSASPLRDATGSISAMALYAGQSCSQINTVVDVQERIHTLLAQARETLSCLHNGQHMEVRSSTEQARAMTETATELLSRAELIAALRELLAAERAGARVASACLADAYSRARQGQLRQLHRQEVSSCRALLQCLAHLDAEPGQAVGDFYEKVMALETLSQRLQLIDKGQRWVSRRVEQLLQRIDDHTIARYLGTVLQYHQADADHS